MNKEQFEAHIQKPLFDAEPEAMDTDLSRQNQKMELNAKLHTFFSEQAGLIEKIVSRIVWDAIQGASFDDDYLYCEIDYDIINRYMSPLYEMGIDLSIEKLSAFIDAHPAVNYSDYHNTGITVYLNNPEILQELGYTLSDGIITDLGR